MSLFRNRWLEKLFQDRAPALRWAVGLMLVPALVGPLLLACAALGTIQLDPMASMLTAGFSVIACAGAWFSHRAFAARRQLTDALTEAQSAAERASAERDQLRGAFDVLPEPVILFDAEDRVVFWNKLYAKHSSLAPGHGDGTLQPGLTFTELMRANLAKGRFPAAAGREEEWLAERLALHTRGTNATYEQRLADDQWVRIEERRTPEGGNVTIRVDITDLKLREASFRLLFDDNPVSMCVFDHTTLQFLAVNQAMIDHYGYSRDQFLAMSIHDITPSEELDAARASIATLSASRLHTGRTWRHLKADGAEILIAAYSRGIEYQNRRARMTAVMDVTERVKVDQELRSTRTFLEQIIDNVPLAVTVKDVKDQRFVMMNRTAEAYWGVPRGEAVGKTVAELFGEERARHVADRDRAAIEADGPVYLGDHGKIGRGDQDRIFSSHRVAVRDPQGKPVYILGVMEDVTERRRAEERIEHLAHFDSLTELPNRANFTMRLASTIEAAEKSGGSFALLFLDLDRFKEVNDVFGHPAGDALLRGGGEAAEPGGGRRLRGAARRRRVHDPASSEGPQPSSAATWRSRVCRWWPRHVCARRPPAAGRCQHRDRALSERRPRRVDRCSPTPTCALSRQGTRGAARSASSKPRWTLQLRERRALAARSAQALARGEIALHYQPIVGRRAARSLGFEALLRWKHPTRGIVSPADFIPLAEESGSILELGEWVLREACREAASWPKPLQIAVNLSPVQFRRGDLPDLVHMVLLESGLRRAGSSSRSPKAC